jgi:hypothetical protein
MDEVDEQRTRTGWRPPAIVRNRRHQPWYGWAATSVTAMITSLRLFDRPDPTPLVLVLAAASVLVALAAGTAAARGYEREQRLRHR